jgi:hypothetical protein
MRNLLILKEELLILKEELARQLSHAETSKWT